LLLEMRYSARDGRDFELLSEELDALPLLELDTTAIHRSLDAQEQLAARPDVSHRVKPIDLLVAAVAERHAAVVLHYDADYELLATHTDLAFESVWAAKRGSIN
jgi:predicted nucleic acid-binding protein